MTSVAINTDEPKALAEARKAPAVAPLTDPLTDLLRVAVERGTPVAELKELVALHERMERRQSERAFFAALNAFQNECPLIHKSKTAKIVSKRTGSSYSYAYAELDEIVSTIRPFLAKHGLSYTWDSEQANGQLTVTCIARHVDGHSLSAKFSLPIESESAMSAQQKVGAALTYARRQSLVAVFGLTATDDDPDAAAEADPTTISEEQADKIDELIEAAGADRARFLSYVGAAKVSEIRASKFTMAVGALEQKVRERRESGGAQ